MAALGAEDSCENGPQNPRGSQRSAVKYLFFAQYRFFIVPFQRLIFYFTFQRVLNIFQKSTRICFNNLIAFSADGNPPSPRVQTDFIRFGIFLLLNQIPLSHFDVRVVKTDRGERKIVRQMIFYPFKEHFATRPFIAEGTLTILFRISADLKS